MDFTYQTHKKLLQSLQAKGYSFITFLEYLENKNTQSYRTAINSTTDRPERSQMTDINDTAHNPERSRRMVIDKVVLNNDAHTSTPLSAAQPKLVILRHDVEQRYESALRFAKIQNQLGIKGTYFFRILPKCFKPEIVKQIAELGHEIGYHYDDLAQCKGDYEKAIIRFEKNLNTLREIAPVETICMDGSPLSKFDNKDLWNKEMSVEKKRDEQSSHLSQLTTHRSFQDFGIKGEPYFDIDFNKVFYLTDTGRRWDGWKTSVRDKVPQQAEWERDGLVFRSTRDIIKAVARQGGGVHFPDNVMFTMHPQRWTDSESQWLKEFVLQNAKNQVKKLLIKR